MGLFIVFIISNVLLVFSFALTSLAAVLMYTVVIVESTTFEYSMLIPLSMIPTGVFSIIYHLKTLKYYSLSFVYKELNDVILWIGNLLFALSISSLALFMLYSIYKILERDSVPEIFYILIFKQHNER